MPPRVSPSIKLIGAAASLLIGIILLATFTGLSFDYEPHNTPTANIVGTVEEIRNSLQAYARDHSGRLPAISGCQEISSVAQLLVPIYLARVPSSMQGEHYKVGVDAAGGKFVVYG